MYLLLRDSHRSNYTVVIAPLITPINCTVYTDLYGMCLYKVTFEVIHQQLLYQLKGYYTGD